MTTEFTLVSTLSSLPATRTFLAKFPQSPPADVSSAGSYSLKPVDIEFMRRLHTKVNLIPVIAKADTMTDEEVAAFKARILKDISFHGIQIFQTPVYEEDDETLAENREIIVSDIYLSFHAGKLGKADLL